MSRSSRLLVTHAWIFRRRTISWGERGRWELGVCGCCVWPWNDAALGAPCGTGCGALATVARGMRVAPVRAPPHTGPPGCILAPDARPSRRIRSRRPNCARSRARPGASPASGGRWRPGLVRGLVPATTGLGQSLGRLVAWARCRDSHKPRQRVRSGRSVLLHLTASHTAHGEEECP